MNRRTIIPVVAVALCTLVAGQSRAAVKLGPWPENADPKMVGKKVVDNLLARRPSTRPQTYPEVCTAYGSLRFCDTIGDKERLDKLIARYAVMLEPNSSIVRHRPPNVDSAIWGAIPLKIYQITRDERYLPLGLHCADYQWEKPANLRPEQEELMNKGLTWHTRFWIDDMFMITGLQVNAYRATRDKKYLDRAAHEMVAYLEKLQQPNGLFFHHAENAQFFWGRGDGWVAVGMTELLMDLPQDHPDHAKIVDGYNKMMAALKKYQGSDGMWKQLIDHDDFWPETSSTGMFIFALANGAKRGWLPADEYLPVVKKAWPALVGYMNENGDMKEVCQGTNVNKDIEFYRARQRITGDLHGQAGMIWAAWSVLDE